MLISYHWLKKFIPNLKHPPQKVADKITLNLVEVESLAKKKGGNTILEIENKGITNRPDCFSQLGLAREVAAYFNLKLNDPLEKLNKLKFTPTKKIPFSVKVLKPSLCYRYSSIVLTDIEVKPSPKWLKAGVENCGVRSINNVVDVTNYVMLELGQPLHAFDYDRLTGKKIIVRKAKTGELIETLDGDKRKLNEKTLVIADGKDPIGIAGIIGGAKSEITNKTKTIVLESANFDKVNNRQSGKFLKLRTEASTRFEKGLDVNLTLPALNRAVELLQKVASAKVVSQTINIQFKKVKSWQVETTPDWINKFLGLKLTSSEMIKILKRLQLKAKLKNKKLVVKIPTYRSDLQMPADIAEEITRIYGYDNIPITPLYGPSLPPKPNLSVNLRRKAKLFFQATGFTETLTPPFLGKKTLELFHFEPENHLKLINPLTIDQEYLRQSLIPSLTLIAKKNLRFFSQLKSFEIDRIFIPQEKNQPKEIINLASLVVNKNSYFQLKGVVESFFENFGINASFKPIGRGKNLNFWQENQTAKIVANQEILGKIGKIKQTVLRKLEIKEEISALEIDFSKIVKLANLIKIYQPIPKYPPIIEHLTFINKNQVLAANILKVAKKTHRLVKKVEITDVFKNRISIEINYQSKKRSLKDKEVAKIRKKIVRNLESLGLKLRGKI